MCGLEKTKHFFAISEHPIKNVNIFCKWGRFNYKNIYSNTTK